MTSRICVAAAAALAATVIFGVWLSGGAGGGIGVATAAAAPVEVPEQAAEQEQQKGKTAKEGTATMLIEPAQLQERLDDPDLRIVDVRSNEQYTQGHIPGAVRVDVGHWKDVALDEGGLHDAIAWSEEAGRIGVNRDTHVVVYGDSLPSTARVWWLLKYLGVEQVSILNGGWDVWTDEDRPIEKSTPQVAATDFEVDFQADRLEEIDSLKQSVKTGDVKVVDARSTEEFTGEEVRGERGGHVPGATHLEWKELLAEDGRFKTREKLKELFRKRGILPDETAVCY